MTGGVPYGTGDRRRIGGWLPPTVRVLGRRWSTFTITALAGSILGAAACLARAGWERLDMGAGAIALLVLALAALLVTATGALATGTPRLVFLRHLLFDTAAAVMALRLLGQPLAPWLDALGLGWGVGLTIGRLGCLSVGCCHGRPWHRGTYYGEEHVTEGLSAAWPGIPLVPVQLVESVGVAALTLALFAHGPHVPGELAAGWVVAYGALRLVLELVRGDGGRWQVLGLSEAQWTGAAMLGAIAWADRVGWLGPAPWRKATASIALVLLVGLLLRGILLGRTHRALLHPGHVADLGLRLRHLVIETDLHAAPAPPMVVTQGGLRVSVSTTIDGGELVWHYGLSLGRRALEPATVRSLVRALAAFGGHRRPASVVRGRHGAWHVEFRMPLGGWVGRLQRDLGLGSSASVHSLGALSVGRPEVV